MNETIKVTKVMQPRLYTKKDGTQGATYQFLGETQGAYPKTIHFNVFGEDRFNGMQLVEGNVYQVDFDIESRAWKDTYITNVSAWRATPVNGFAQQPQTPQQPVQQPQHYYAPQAPMQQAQAPAPMPQQDGDPLPF